MTEPVPRGRSMLVLAGFIGLALAAGVLGSLWTTPATSSWYRDIRKPSWTPPSWVFGPVWTTLYVLMGAAAWRVWRVAGWKGGRGALVTWGVQLALNTVWSLLFFAMRRFDLGFYDIFALAIAIAMTMEAFRRHDRPAMWMLVPYLVWVIYATGLNFAIWRMN